jgi:hypothetical protein
VCGVLDVPLIERVCVPLLFSLELRMVCRLALRLWHTPGSHRTSAFSSR